MNNKIPKNNYWWHFIASAFYVVVAAASVWILYGAGKRDFTISGFDFLLLSFATFRIIRLFVYDIIADFIRDYFKKFERGFNKTVYEILYCPWCMGIWAAWFISMLYFLFPWAWYFIFFLALAGIGSMIQILSNVWLNVISFLKAKSEK